IHVFSDVNVAAHKDDRAADFASDGVEVSVEFVLSGLLRLAGLGFFGHGWCGPLGFCGRRGASTEEVEARTGWRREARRIELHDLGGDDAFGARSPRKRLDHQLAVERRDGFCKELDVFPAGSGTCRAGRLEGPRLKVRVL